MRNRPLLSFEKKKKKSYFTDLEGGPEPWGASTLLSIFRPGSFRPPYRRGLPGERRSLSCTPSPQSHICSGPLSVDDLQPTGWWGSGLSHSPPGNRPPPGLWSEDERSANSGVTSNGKVIVAIVLSTVPRWEC